MFSAQTSECVIRGRLRCTIQYNVLPVLDKLARRWKRTKRTGCTVHTQANDGAVRARVMDLNPVVTSSDFPRLVHSVRYLLY